MDLGYLLLLSLLLILSLPYLRISPPPPPNFPPHPLPPPNAPPKPPPPPDEDADDPPNKSKEFEELGANPTRTKTISTHTAAVKLLNEFLTAKGMSPLPAKSTDNYSENVCKEKDVCTIHYRLCGSLRRSSKKRKIHYFQAKLQRINLGDFDLDPAKIN